MPPPYHVLVADDDAMIRSLVARILVRTYPQVTVREVANGLEALTIYDQQVPDLLITNYNMPGLDGFGLVTTLRTTRQATLPILMISAHPSAEARARACGVTAFLLKPFSLSGLTTTLLTLLPP